MMEAIQGHKRILLGIDTYLPTYLVVEGHRRVKKKLISDSQKMAKTLDHSTKAHL